MSPRLKPAQWLLRTKLSCAGGATRALNPSRLQTLIIVEPSQRLKCFVVLLAFSFMFRDRVIRCHQGFSVLRSGQAQGGDAGSWSWRTSVFLTLSVAGASEASILLSLLSAHMRSHILTLNFKFKKKHVLKKNSSYI